MKTVVAAIRVLMLPLAGLAALPAGAQQATAPSPQGRAVFEKWCAPCHAAGPFHAGTVALEKKYQGAAVSAVLEERKDLTAAFVEYIIRNGVNAMPPFRRTEISDAEMHAVAAWLAGSK